MDYKISVIIPNRNGGSTIGLCLEALFKSAHNSFEVVVVDDCSTDNSISIIEKYPCSLVKLEHHVGTAHARNIGAMQSSGEILFFIDSDCLVFEDTLALAEKLSSTHGLNTVIGGTYTIHPYDRTFYSAFQSAYINYSELKNFQYPDYIAAHAMIISSHTFKETGGFPADFLPIIEDVEFSHRLRRNGYKLIMEPNLKVQHIFGYRNMADSLRNGYRKSKYWMIYSIGNKDVLSDSGTASYEMKTNVFSMFGSLVLLGLYLANFNPIFLFLFAVLIGGNIALNLKLFSHFYKSGGQAFLLTASLYYMFVYPLAVGLGVVAGTMNYILFQNQK